MSTRMNIAIVGNETLCKELLSVISQGNNSRIFEIDKIPNDESFDVLIDLDFDKAPDSHWNAISKIKTQYFLLGACLTQLGFVNFANQKEKVFGICNMPTLLGRNTLEYSSPIGLELPQNIVKALNYFEAIKVDDRVGMVTPRVICMIINEAYYTLQEGTANKSDIDLGMKLGTAYPMGPFEWADKIGSQNVYHLLKAVFDDTMDERYKICNLLKTEAFKAN